MPFPFSSDALGKSRKTKVQIQFIETTKKKCLLSSTSTKSAIKLFKCIQSTREASQFLSFTWTLQFYLMLVLKICSDVVMTMPTQHSCFLLSLRKWADIRVIYVAIKLQHVTTFLFSLIRASSFLRIIVKEGLAHSLDIAFWGPNLKPGKKSTLYI